MLKKFYRFSYVTGTVLLIVSMLMSIMPAFPAYAAQGSTKTSAGSCANPVNKNHYTAGDVIVLDFQGFEPGSTHSWTITGNPGGSSGDPGIVVASGTFTADANGDWCVDNAYTVQPDDWGEYHVSVEGGKGDNYRVLQEPAPGDLNISVTKTPSVSTILFPGGLVTFTITITNNESFDLAVTQKSDSVFSDIGDCAGITNLLAGQTVTCTFTGEVTGPAGSDHVNTFTVGATNGQQTTIVSDNAVVRIQDLPTLSLTLDKNANPTTLQPPGGDVTFSVLVTNTTSEAVDLTSLEDDVFGNLNNKGTCSVPQTLAASGGTYSCEFTGQVLGNLAGDFHVDTVTATISLGSQTAQASDTARVDFVEETNLGLTVSKVPSPSSVVEPGGDVTFTVTVVNTSNVVVELTTLDDDVFGDLDTQGTCSLPQTLGIGGSYSCELTMEITGPHTNTVTATIDYQGTTVSDSATATVIYNLRPDPSITVTKTANPTSMDEPGGQATFTVQVTNNSDFQVRINSITDNRFGDLNLLLGSSCFGSEGTPIAAGETFTCTFTGDVSGTIGNPHVNTVSVQVIDELGNTGDGSDDATVTFNPLPTISVSKTANPTTVNELGGETTFTIVVTNTSIETVWLTGLEDNVFGNLNGRGNCSVIQVIPASGTYECFFTAILEGEPDTPHVNVVTAYAEDSSNNQTSASDDEQVNFENQNPAITVTKTAFPTTIDEPGGSIDFTVQVTNDTGEPVTLNTLTDDIFGDLDSLGDCATGGVIPGNETYTCTFSGLVVGDAGDQHTNVVSAAATDNEGNQATGQDSAVVTITNIPTLIEVTKTASPTAVTEPGEDVTFTVVVDNLTIEDITLTSLVDDVFGDLNGQGDCTFPAPIAGSGSFTCSFVAAVNGDAGFVHVDTVTATAVDNDGSEATDSDSAQVDVVDAVPTIQVIKLANPTSVPAPAAAVSYDVEVVNNSLEEVTLTQLLDNQFGDLNGLGDCATGGTILPGNSYTCSFVQTINGQSGDTHSNVIEATVVDNEGNETTGSDDADVIFTDPPVIELVDPCSVGCDQPNVTGQICNSDLADDYFGQIDWEMFVDSTSIGSGTILSIPADSCVEVSLPTQGNGLYSIVATLVDENGTTVETSCGPLSCQAPVTPTPIPPVTPPTGSTPVFIPVTGFDFSPGAMISMIQNFGFALIALGLVMHGFSLNGKNKKETE